MTKTSTNSDLTCAEQPRIGECDSQPPFYEVPFIYGPGPRMAMEWRCEECIEAGEEFELEDDTVYWIGEDGERKATAEEIEDAYLNSRLEEVLGWD